MTREEFEAVELEFLKGIDASVKDAERKLACADVDQDDEEAYMDAYDAIFHCETCIVRETMEVIWPSIEKYIEWLRAEVPVPA